MNMYKSLPIILFLMIFISSCEKESKILEPNAENLMGYWVRPQYNDSTIIFERSEKFVDDYGCAFESKNTFLERKNAGWCGTPPITYTDYVGSWHIQDSVIIIQTSDWSGNVTYVWKMLALTDNSLTVCNIVDSNSK